MTNSMKSLTILTFSSIIGSGTVIAMKQEVTHSLMISSHTQQAAYATPEFHSTCTPTNLPSDIKDPIIRCTATNIETKKTLVKHVHCSLTIPHDTIPLVMYAISTVHDAIFEHSNIQSTIKNPIIVVRIKKNGSDNDFHVPLPAQLFINCTDGSILHLHETDGSKLFKSHPIFKKIPLRITATCTNNPNFQEGGNSFAEQFDFAMDEFYENAVGIWEDAEHKSELEEAGIITRTTTPIPQLVWGPFGPFIRDVLCTKFGHGPHGCSNKEMFIRSYFTNVIQPKIPLILWFLNNYQYDEQKLPAEIIQLIITKLYPSDLINIIIK